MLFGALWVFVLLSISHLVVHAALNFIGNTCKNFDTYGNVEKPIEDAFELGVRITKEAYDTIEQLLDKSEQLTTEDLKRLNRMATAFLVPPDDLDSEQALEDLRGMGRQQTSAEGAVTHEQSRCVRETIQYNRRNHDENQLWSSTRRRTHNTASAPKHIRSEVLRHATKSTRRRGKQI